MTSVDIFRAEDFKYMDENCGVSTDTLMQNAAEGLYVHLDKLDRLNGNICVICGKGNNGGDGYALAVLLKKRGYTVTVIPVEEPASALAIKYKDLYAQDKGTFSTDITTALKNADTVVDCMFGISFRGEVREPYASVIKAINERDAFVLAADIPSGITADNDTLPDLSVRATVTCTFTGLKAALCSYPSKSVCGAIHVVDIGIPSQVIDAQKPYATVADRRMLDFLPQRPDDGHKGTFGTVSALCGNDEMCGAAYMAAISALRSGVGLVRIHTSAYCAGILKQKLAEPIISAKTEAESILASKPDALLVGCGCGREFDDTIRKLVKTTDIPMIIDADGINALTKDIQLYRSDNTNRVITPHPGEMARFLGISTKEVNGNRIQTTVEVAKKHKAVTVLKGACTIIAAPDGRLCLSPFANSGLAKGGSGDVLAGLIASLLAQGISAFDAACLGVFLHGLAAERLVAAKGTYAMLPSELPEEIGRIMYFR